MSIDLNLSLSANFKLYEAVYSQTAKRNGISNIPDIFQIEALEKVAQNILQPVRDYYGKPMKPSSWFRCEELEKIVADKSYQRYLVKQGYEDTPVVWKK